MHHFGLLEGIEEQRLVLGSAPAPLGLSHLDDGAKTEEHVVEHLVIRDART